MYHHSEEERDPQDVIDEAMYRAECLEDEQMVRAFETQAAEAAAKDSTDSGRLLPSDL